MTAAAVYTPVAWLLVAAGSAVGGALRYWISGRFSAGPGERFPLGTLVVNVSGCLLAGLVLALLHAAPAGSWPHDWLHNGLAFGLSGVLGSYTTVGSFSLQSLQLIDDGNWRGGLLNIALSFSGCLGAVGLGYWIGIGIGMGMGIGIGLRGGFG